MSEKDNNTVELDAFKAEVWARVDGKGFSHLRDEYPPGKYLSSLDIALLAEKIGTSPYWLITGEQDPYEVRYIHCTDSYPYDD